MGKVNQLVVRWKERKKMNMKSIYLLQDQIFIKGIHQKTMTTKRDKQLVNQVTYKNMSRAANITKKTDKACTDCITFPIQEKLPNGRLPTVKQALGHLFYTNTQNAGEQQSQNLHNVAADIMNHWISCNIYTITHKSVREKLSKFVVTYEKLKKYAAAKKNGKPFKDTLSTFGQECEKLFDIRTSDKTRQTTQERVWGVKETELERKFYIGQCKTPQVILIS